MATSVNVYLFLADPEETREWDYDVIEVDKSLDRGVTWQRITTPTTRLLIGPLQYNYVFRDPDSEPGAYYRAVLSSTLTVNPPLDVPQPPQLGIDNTFETIMTVDELRTFYLFGIDLTNDAGTAYPDALFAHYIQSAIRQTEMEIDVNFLPTLYDEEYDFYRKDYENHFYLRLKERPLIDVVRLAIQNGDKTLMEYPRAWLRLDHHKSTLQVFPTGDAVLQTQYVFGGAGNPFVYGSYDYVPGLIRCKYFAGFPLGDLRYMPLVKDVVGKRASFGPLNISGDLVAGAGLASQSISIDGLSRSVSTTNSSTNAGFGARLLMYQKELKGALATLKSYFGGIRMTVV